MIKNGPVIHHPGDTAYVKDMGTISAAKAAVAVKAKRVVPMHYRTFPILTQDATPFLKAVSAKKIAHSEMKPGETLRFDGKRLGK